MVYIPVFTYFVAGIAFLANLRLTLVKFSNGGDFMRAAFFTICVSITLTFLTGCSKDQSDDSSKKVNQSFIQKIEGLISGVNTVEIKDDVLTVVDEKGTPIANAQVLVGMGLNTPVQNNFLTTDSNGQFQAPAGWTSTQPVTLSSDGFLRVTYLAQTPKAQKFVMRKADLNQRFELSGQTPGFNIQNGDGNADFSIVMPMLQKVDLLHFNLDLLLSPELEHLNIAGTDITVPSNVTLPKQKENYIIPITLEKPVYKTFFNSPGSKKLFAARGQFPFKKIVKAMRDGVLFVDLINDFQFMGGGMRQVNITAQTQILDIPINEVQFSQKYSVVNQSVLNGEVLLGASMAENGIDYYPTDVRNLTAGGTDSLNVIPNSNPHLVSVLKRKDEVNKNPGKDRLSAVALPFVNGLAPKHLPLMENPALQSPYYVKVPPMKPMVGVSGVATYATLSKVIISTVDGAEVEAVHPGWEVYGYGWLNVVEIPVWPGESVPLSSVTEKKRWSVALIGSTTHTSVELGPEMMQALTHVTNSSVDF